MAYVLKGVLEGNIGELVTLGSGKLWHSMSNSLMAGTSTIRLRHHGVVS